MKTVVLPVGEDALAEAARLIRAGEIVAFPTETVYGLGANALDGAAVLKIFEAKGRPADNPLIAHIAHPDALSLLARRVPERARALMRAFWPPRCSGPRACPSPRPAPTAAGVPAPRPRRMCWRTWTGASR